ncbi:hypothetical protein C5B91_12775 [Haloferax sp. Atlit-10N]|nr:hypothetical protein C5B87_09205 [Haloferax sp. Atlit-16N]RDZ58435.1 hypothetical protein C5B91_12775 [Haloferax sp. Atlit-10N]
MGLHDTGHSETRHRLSSRDQTEPGHPDYCTAMRAKRVLAGRFSSSSLRGDYRSVSDSRRSKKVVWDR